MKKKRKKKRTGISRRLLLLGALLVSGASSPSALANPQSVNREKGRTATTRTIEGRVLTSAGTAVPGAVVLLKDSKSLQVRSYIAQTGGEYHFFGLSTDINYTLRAENQGMTSKQKTVSVFDGHREVKLDLKLSRKIQQSKK